MVAFESVCVDQELLYYEPLNNKVMKKLFISGGLVPINFIYQELMALIGNPRFEFYRTDVSMAGAFPLSLKSFNEFTEKADVCGVCFTPMGNSLAEKTDENTVFQFFITPIFKENPKKTKDIDEARDIPNLIAMIPIDEMYYRCWEDFYQLKGDVVSGCTLLEAEASYSLENELLNLV